MKTIPVDRGSKTLHSHQARTATDTHEHKLGG